MFRTRDSKSNSAQQQAQYEVRLTIIRAYVHTKAQIRSYNRVFSPHAWITRAKPRPINSNPPTYPHPQGVPSYPLILRN